MTIINPPKIFIVSFIFLFFTAQITNAASISIFPQNSIIQGEPVMVQIYGAKLSDIQKLSFEGKKLDIFNYQNKPTALLGIDLNKKAGNYKILLNLINGSSTESILTVKAREKYETYLAVPEKLGGNSTSNQIKVVSTLSQENAILAVIKTFARNLWTKPFIYPISNPIVTDPYGFSRTSGAASITHKGADFKAVEGKKVVAMNRGIVRIARTLTVYGKIVVIDHGYGVMSFYIHLSKIKVNVGELVEQGQLIGYSGSTGYSTGPHLHLSLRIGNISIDPIKFLDLFTR